MPEYKNLLAKMLAVQKEMKAIKKDEVNPHFKNRYFDINSLIAELKPVLNKIGLVVNQPLDTIDGRCVIRTVIADPTSGEASGSAIPLPDGLDPQKLGGAVTYYRRYALTSLFLLEAEDDDANEASSEPRYTKEFTLHPTAARKNCQACGKEYNPRPGTESFSTLCYPCYKAGAKPKPKVDDTPTINTDEPPF